MKAKLQRRIQRYGWDMAASYYENSWQAQLQPVHEQLLELANIQAGERVLDIAAGTGLLTYRIAEQVGESGHVLGTDISEEMVKLAKETAATQGITNVRVERMEAEQLKCDEYTFDLVVCSLGLMYVPDAAAAFAEMYRVLKQNGRATVAVWGARQSCGWAESFPIVDTRVKSEVCPLFFGLGTGNTAIHAFEKAGFTEITLQRIESPIEFDTGEDANEAVFLGGPVALAYSRFDRDVREQVQAEYLASIEPYRQDEGYAIPSEYVVAQGYKI
jgi:ubiquinone/menaquinone biosynthesis C-methylase UbiE